MDALLQALLASPLPAPASLDEAFRPREAPDEAPPIDQAFLGGLAARGLGLAFSAGYHAALRALVPALPPSSLTALCVTEAGESHPRAVRTSLSPSGADRFLLRGEKSFVTFADRADELLVAARAGEDASGRPALRIARVPAKRAGVRVERLPPLPFAPDVPHGRVLFEDAEIEASDLLPGDGYEDYVKPFRTVEDAHVFGALLGYLVGVARRAPWPPEAKERLLALALSVRAVALLDPKRRETHLALAGAIDAVRAFLRDVDPLWSRAPEDERARWHRDRPLLEIAGKARDARLARARASLG